jgi:hypothetical protein
MQREYKGFKVGDVVEIVFIDDIRKDLEGRVAKIKFIDDAGQIWLEGMPIAVVPEVDTLRIIEKAE